MSPDDNDIRIVREPITLLAVQEIANRWYRNRVKGVVDITREIIALGGEWHMDANAVLLGDGSKQEGVGGFSVYLEKQGEDALEYKSHINIRPVQGNMGVEIKDKEIRASMKSVIVRLLPELKL